MNDLECGTGKKGVLKRRYHTAYAHCAGNTGTQDFLSRWRNLNEQAKSWENTDVENVSGEKKWSHVGKEE